MKQTPKNLQSPISQSLLRPDLLAIAELVAAKSMVLDLGCGDGDLLACLVADKGVTGRGIELNEASVLTCVRKGLSVRQGKLEEGMADYPDGWFDTVVLSQTLPFLNDPSEIIHEMLRIGKQAIVSFPNFGYWRNRVGLLVGGKMPALPELNTHWSDAPRWQGFTIVDFEGLCKNAGIHITQQIYLVNGRRLRTTVAPNLRATTAIFTLT
jgi:methionine biosynthesis protein MetW